MGASVAGVALGVVPWPFATAASTVACFAGFTPVHEAAHRNVSRSPWLNDAVGHACALLQLGTLLPYRFLHGEHHRNPNHPDRDPDAWSGRGPRWLLPLRWATQDVAYVAFYGRRWSTRPWRERLDLLACALLYVAVALGTAWLDPRLCFAVGVAWFVPARLAVVALAATFSWLPHAPHVVGDRYRATSVWSAPWLTVLLLGQNFHGVHHLYPHVPFHRLPGTWRAQRAELRARGVVDRGEAP